MTFSNGGATLLLPKDKGEEELQKDPLSGHVSRSGLETKGRRSRAKNGMPKWLRCGIVAKL